jgi:hypothetical protein
MKENAFLLTFFAVVIFSIMIYFGKESPAQTGALEMQNPGVQGRVMSIYGPLENARVRVPGHEKYALTDRQGRFSLIPSRESSTCIIVASE